jgi:hypothetical protein
MAKDIPYKPVFPYTGKQIGAQAASVGLATAIDRVNKEMKDLLSTTNFTQ